MCGVLEHAGELKSVKNIFSAHKVGSTNSTNYHMMHETYNFEI